jgi:hypothetical protein
VAVLALETDGDHRDVNVSSYKVVGFKIGHTFDVSQTEGAPISNPINMALAGDDQGVNAALTAFAKDVLHIDVELVESDNPNWGGSCSYDLEGRSVRILDGGNRFNAYSMARATRIYRMS